MGELDNDGILWLAAGGILVAEALVTPTVSTLSVSFFELTRSLSYPQYRRAVRAGK